MTIKLLCKDVDIIWEAIKIDTSRCWNQFIAYYRLMSCDPPQKRFSHDEIVARTEVNNACDRLAQPPQPHNVFSSTEELLWKSVPEVVAIGWSVPAQELEGSAVGWLVVSVVFPFHPKCVRWDSGLVKGKANPWRWYRRFAINCASITLYGV